jgi:uncharacterized protein (TIGR01777 family)
VQNGPILLSGGSGLVGGRTLRVLADRGCTIRALTRNPSRVAPRPGVHAVGWDGCSPGAGALDGVAAIVHLSGEPVFGGPATRSRLRRIYESRVTSTRLLVEAIGALPPGTRPSALVCASAVGYYGDRGEEMLEEGAEPGSGFLARLCQDWEREAARAEDLGVRRVSLRFGVVLSREGGALAPLARVFRLGLGGRVGSGRQWFPWIHLNDAVALILAALEQDALSGAVNAVAPNPVRNAEFTRALAERVPVPALALRAALGPLAGELLDSRRVVPARVSASDFGFLYPELEIALAAELSG